MFRWVWQLFQDGPGLSQLDPKGKPYNTPAQVGGVGGVVVVAVVVVVVVFVRNHHPLIIL